MFLFARIIKTLFSFMEGNDRVFQLGIIQARFNGKLLVNVNKQQVSHKDYLLLNDHEFARMVTEIVEQSNDDKM